MKKFLESLKYFTLPIITIVFFIMGEIGENTGKGNQCAEGTWCFLWFPVLLAILGTVSGIIGLKKLFVNEGTKTRLLFVVAFVLLIIFFIIWMIYMEGRV